MYEVGSGVHNELSVTGFFTFVVVVVLGFFPSLWVRPV